MSFLKNLFGGGKQKAEPAGKTLEHKGFLIRATPFSEGGQYQTSGIITREIDGTVKEYKFIRADRFAGRDEAEEFALRKGCQIIDEQGDRIFG